MTPEETLKQGIHRLLGNLPGFIRGILKSPIDKIAEEITILARIYVETKIEEERYRIQKNKGSGQWPLYLK